MAIELNPTDSIGAKSNGAPIISGATGKNKKLDIGGALRNFSARNTSSKSGNADLGLKRLVNTDGSKASQSAAQRNKEDDAWWENGGNYEVSYIRGKRIINSTKGSGVVMTEDVTATHSNGKPKTTRTVYEDETLETHYKKDGRATHTVRKDKEDHITGYIMYDQKNKMRFLDKNKQPTFEWTIENGMFTSIDSKTGKKFTVKIDDSDKPKSLS